MAVKKPLVLGSDGSIEQLQSGDTLDITMPAGADTIIMTLAEAVGNGDVLCINSNGVVKADKDDTQKTKVVGIATSSGSVGDSIDVRTTSQQGGLSGLTAGGVIYLDNSGAMTQTLPTFGTVVRLGVALSATDMLVEISQPIKL